jgi:CheY-like chemotaxis protein/nitrogen-specific signal transduction histidine kinase
MHRGERTGRAASEDRDLEGEVARLRRELADVSSACRARDELLAVAAHALRTPLTAILGWINLVRAGELDPATSARAVDTIERNARRQADLIAELVDATRILTGRLQLNRARVDLLRVVDAALEGIRAAAEAKPVRVHASLDPAGPMWGDPDRLQQVVAILLSNAVKFTSPGGRIDVRLERVTAGAELRVQDDGAGIPADALPHLFDRLPLVASGAGKSDRSGRGQLGLGLSIARHLADLHGGGLTAASEGPGRGATFTLRLPLRGAAADGPMEERALAPAPDPRLAGRRVLVVADPAGRDALARMLSARGADVVAAGSSDEALRVVVAFAPEAIIVDLEMRREDGCELIRRVRALGDENGGRTPALALTSDGGADDRLRTLRAGFQIHVAKPVHPLELASVVASLTARAPQRHGGVVSQDRDS